MTSRNPFFVVRERSPADADPSMPPLPWKGVHREFPLTATDMEEERPHAEAAENEGSKGRQKQCLLDICGEVPAEKEESSDRQGDETGQALGKPAGSQRRRESKRLRPCADGAVVEGVEGVPPGKKRTPQENPR